MEDKEIQKIVEDCVVILMRNEGEIIRNDVSEIAITHKLAEYLQSSFRELSVDVGYNRRTIDGRKPKYYLEDKYGIPDIIVHKRLTNKQNLLIIEIKKQNNTDSIGRENDFNKLTRFTDSEDKCGYNYQLGLFLDIPIEDGQEPRYFWYKDGEKLCCL